jgi:hypothetical protein
VTGFVYEWRWMQSVGLPSLPGRKGQHCRVVVRDRMNKAWVEFEDGLSAVVSRNGLRRSRADRD